MRKFFALILISPFLFTIVFVSGCGKETASTLTLPSKGESEDLSYSTEKQYSTEGKELEFKYGGEVNVNTKKSGQSVWSWFTEKIKKGSVKADPGSQEKNNENKKDNKFKVVGGKYTRTWSKFLAGVDSVRNFFAKITGVNGESK